MDEKLIVGAIFGVMLVLAIAGINSLKGLAKSDSEGARRLKIVIRAAIGLAVGSFIYSTFGGTAASAIIAAVVVFFWVRQGFKK